MKRQSEVALAYVRAMRTGRLVWTHGYKSRVVKDARGYTNRVVDEQRDGEYFPRQLIYVDPYAYSGENAVDVRKLAFKVEQVFSVLDGFMKLGHLDTLRQDRPS